MAAKSLSATMAQIVNSQFSQSFISGSKIARMQKAGIHRMPRRPNTANPRGWSTKRLKQKNKVPSSVCLAKMKNEVLSQPSALYNFSKLHSYRSLADKSSVAGSSASTYYNPARCQSLEKISNSKQYALNITSDRDDEFADDNDRVHTDKDPKIVANKIHLVDESVVDAVYKNVKEITKDIDKLKAADNKIKGKVKVKTFKASFGKYVQSNESTNTFSHTLNKPVRVTDANWAPTVQRSDDINLNDAKKNLAMDINVLVSVKPQDNVIENEIGFQDISNQKQKVVLSEEGLKRHHLSGSMSREHLAQEIGKLYDFLKNNGAIQINNSAETSFDKCQEYNKIKNLYFNALECVKAFKALSVSTADRSLSEESSRVVQESNLESSKPLDQGKKRRLLMTGIPSLTKVRTYASDSGTQKTDCDKAKKLPCLQPSDLSVGPPKIASKTVCEKLCMPCCKPARDPPLCFYPYHKPPCKKLKPPRPSYSECKQLFEMKPMVPCECTVPRATTCKPSADSQKCTKK